VLLLASSGCGSTPKDGPRALRFGPAPDYRPPALSRAVAKAARVSGLRCDVHSPRRVGAHLEIFVHGLDVVIPAGIGIAPPVIRDGAYVRRGRCSYPLRTTDPTGVIEVDRHVHATVGDFFAIWGQPVSPRRVLGFRIADLDHVRAFVNGRPWQGDPAAIPLSRHVSVVIEVGRHVARHPVYVFPPPL
jgi:hypothetical protein